MNGRVFITVTWHNGQEETFTLHGGGPWGWRFSHDRKVLVIRSERGVRFEIPIGGIRHYCVDTHERLSGRPGPSSDWDERSAWNLVPPAPAAPTRTESFGPGEQVGGTAKPWAAIVNDLLNEFGDTFFPPNLPKGGQPTYGEIRGWLGTKLRDLGPPPSV